MRLKGIYLVLITCLLTVLLWIAAKASIEAVTLQPLKSVAQLFALVAATLLGWQFFIATRIRLIERLFGGLDKVYRIHHLIGGIAYSLILLHPTLLVLEALPNIDLAVMHILPFAPGIDIGRIFGILALYCFDIILIVTFFVKIPYHLWKKLHEYIGLPLLFLFFHVFTISSDVAVSWPLRVWILGILLFALGCYIYKRFLYYKFGPRFEYEIVSHQSLDVVNEFVMKPVGKGIEYVPGQFAFIRFLNSMVSRELHPFTISGSSEGTLRMSIKQSGDFTAKLGEIKVGDKVTIYGPHGAFFEKFYAKPASEVIFIAGGIGITPFLSLLKSIPKSNTRKIVLYYAVSDQDEAVYLEELKTNMSGKNIELKLVLSKIEGRLTAERIKSEVGTLNEKLIFLCGPVPMMKSLAKQFNGIGVKNSQIIYEEFSLTS